MVQVRTALPHDAQSIAQLHATSWRENYRGMLADAYLDGDLLAERLGVWQQRLAASRDTTFICLASVAECPIGFACAVADSDPRWGVLLDNVHVASSEQRRGIGRRLVFEVAQWVQENHPQQGLYVWVIDANSDAKTFYERLGATAVEQTVREAPGGALVAECRYAWNDLAFLCSVTTTPAGWP